MRSVRRSDFDVTNTVQVSSPDAVLAAVKTLFQPTWPTLSFAPLEQAFQLLQSVVDHEAAAVVGSQRHGFVAAPEPGGLGGGQG